MEVAVCKPRTEAAGETKPTGTLTLGGSLQSGEKTDVCCLSRPVGGAQVAPPQRAHTRASAVL